jgi:lysophospholipid acyltransferase (LPLAT)-like uncharacterized protein
MNTLDKILAEITGTALYLNAAMVHKTCRIFTSGSENIKQALDYDGPVIATSWHGMTMMVIAFAKRYVDLSSFMGITPDDQDGRTLDVFGRRLGVEVFIMNLYGDSTFGMSRKLVELIKRMKSGKNLIIHPDGPFGPAYKIKPGIIYLAKKTRAMILPLGCYCRHSYHVPRWDRYTLPFPFSKVHVQVGEPILINDEDQPLEEISRDVEDTLNRLTFQAAANYYGISRKTSRL